MSFLRTVRQPLLRPLSRPTPRVAFAGRRYASQDYGSPEGDMVKEAPKDRGPNPSEHLEHPGPPPPSTAGKSEQGSQQQQGQGQQQPKSDNSGNNKGTQAAQPKILNESPPQGEHAPDDVRQHNEEVDRRAEQASSKVRDEDIEKDKVGKDYWRGESCTYLK